MSKKEFNIKKLGFHKFHECQTQYKQHWKKDGTDEVVGYRYVERSAEKGGVCVFTPNTISPDDYSQYVKNIVNPIINQNKDERTK